MSPRLTQIGLACVLALLVGCANPKPPPVLNQVDEVRTADASTQAEQLAPQAYLHAERLREQARAAGDRGNTVEAQILSEHAIAAYEHAHVLSRLALAEDRLSHAKAKLARLEQELGAADEKQQRLLAEAEALELKVKVAQNALPLPTPEKASKQRLEARRKAVLALTSEARLLCLSTRLLEPDASIGEELIRLDELEQKARTLARAPIEQATLLRSTCLSRLTETRRPVTQENPAQGQPDKLLSALSSMGGLFPFRDDRGVVVVLRDLFSRAPKALTAQALATLQSLGRVAKTHPDFPVLLVMHTAHGDSRADAEQALSTLRAALVEAGAPPRVETYVAGDSQPLRDSKQPEAVDRNRRVEVVFVAPSY